MKNKGIKDNKKEDAVMSRYAKSCCTYGGGMGSLAGFGKGSNCVCSFPTLVILILIVLQFSKGSNRGYDDGNWFGDKQVGNGVLFIIALFFLSCAGCGRGNVGY